MEPWEIFCCTVCPWHKSVYHTAAVTSIAKTWLGRFIIAYNRMTQSPAGRTLSLPLPKPLDPIQGSLVCHQSQPGKGMWVTNEPAYFPQTNIPNTITHVQQSPCLHDQPFSPLSCWKMCMCSILQ